MHLVFCFQICRSARVHQGYDEVKVSFLGANRSEKLAGIARLQQQRELAVLYITTQQASHGCELVIGWIVQSSVVSCGSPYSRATAIAQSYPSQLCNDINMKVGTGTQD